MQMMDHFVKLRLYQLNEGLDDRMPVTLKELAHTLCCTERNVKLLIRKMAEQQWLEWEAGRGRGNRSHLIFLEPAQCSIMNIFQWYLDEGKFEMAVDLLKESMPSILREELSAILNRHFGYERTFEGQSKDTLKIPFSRKLTSINPFFSSVSTESHLARQLFDTLLQYNEKTGLLEPHLAHAWEVSDNASVWTFYLRKEILFHHGRELTAKDIEYTFLEIKNPENQSPNRWQAEYITAIHIIGDYTIQFCLHSPNLMFGRFVSSLGMAIMPYDVEQKETALVGTGPFRMAKYNDQVLIFDAFKDYFKERALIDRIEFWFLPEGTNIEMNYQLSEQKQQGSEREVTIEETGCFYLGFNFHQSGFVQDPRFREAIFHLLDTKKLILELGDTRIARAASFFSMKSREAVFSKTSLATAKKLLDACGYNGEPLTLALFDMKSSMEDAAWIVQQGKRIGLSISLEPFSLLEYHHPKIARNAHMVLMGELFESDEEISFIKVFKTHTSFINRWLHAEQKERIAGMLEAMMQEGDSSVRSRWIDQIEDYIKKERLILFNYHIKRRKQYPAALKGVSINAFGWADFSKLWIQPMSIAEASE